MPLSVDGIVCTQVVGKTNESSFPKKEGEYEESGLVIRETSHDLRSSLDYDHTSQVTLQNSDSDSRIINTIISTRKLQTDCNLS